MLIPKTLSSVFTKEDFINCSKILIPQHHIGKQYSNVNIVGGTSGNITVITSNKNSIRVNHLHNNDLFLSYIVSGRIKYFWKDRVESSSKKLPNDFFA